MSDDLIQQISDLIMEDPDFQSLSQSRDVYCPFEALGAARMEIRHSNFLANLITPNASHGFGDMLLRSFIETFLFKADAKELLLELHLTDLSDAEIRREWKNIDLLVRIPRSHKPDVVLVVEIKIESGEHGDQLEEYEETIKEAYPSAETHFFFLTPDGTESSRPDWLDVAFSTILDAFENVLKAGEGQPDARRMVELYIAMMRRRYVENEKLNELANKIWQRHREALEFLIEQQPNESGDFLQEIADRDIPKQISEAFKEQGVAMTFIPYTKSSRYIRLAVSEWDNVPGMRISEEEEGRRADSKRMVLMELGVYHDGVFVRWKVGPTPQEYRKTFIQTLNPDLIKKNPEKVRDKWTRISTERFTSKKEIEDIIKGKWDEKLLSRVVADMVKHATKTAKEYDSKLRNAGLLI